MLPITPVIPAYRTVAHAGQIWEVDRITHRKMLQCLVSRDRRPFTAPPADGGRNPDLGDWSPYPRL